jgi:predicted N-acetyltransferase YhbS
LIIRPPGPEDNEELIQLDRVAPEEGLVSYYVDRRPKYIRKPDADKFFPFVAEEDDRIVGVIFSSVDEFIVNGEPRTCDYISSLRVHPDHQRRGIGSSLVNHAVESGKEEGAEVFWAVVIGKNVPSFSTFSSCGFSGVGRLGFKVLVSKSTKRLSGASLRKAREEDLDAMAAMFSSYYGNHNFQPVDMTKWLRRRCMFGESLMGVTYVAERRGRIVAMVRASKQWKTTKMIITKLSLRMRLFSSLYRLGIEDGSLLKMLDLSMLSYSEGEELAAIDLLNLARERYRDECRIGIVQYGLQGKEEGLLGRVRGFPGYSDVMAMGSGLEQKKLDPIFPSR